ncbi:SDR family oxidoreductase [bacterium]|nr:SDR family oxidoreductase [bacterium]
MADLYLITGGAGFIGSNLADALVRDGERVRIFDDFSSGRIENLLAVRERIEIVEGDLRDFDAVRRAMRGVNYVSHQGALRSVERSVDDPMSSNAVNVQGTLNVLQAAREAGVTRVAYASSSSAYGDTEVLPKTEDLAPAPISPYAVSKLAAEHYCRVYSRLYGLETVSLRYFNVFGPKQSPESKYAAVVPLFLRAAFQGEPLEIHGDGLQSRDFTYIDNVVLANRLAMATPGVGGSVFNVACGSRHSLLDIAAIIGRFLGRELPRNHVAPRRGDVRHTQASIERITAALGFQPTVGFEEGMRRTFEWFKGQWKGSPSAER